MATFGPKAWVNPFGKMSIFRLFEVLVFIAQKGVFSFQNIVKDIFLAYFNKKKKLQQRPLLSKNNRLTPLEKHQFFDFLNFLFLLPRKPFFVLKYRKTHFPGLICLSKGSWKKGHFQDQNHGLTPLEKSRISLTSLEKCQFLNF